jgi:hypothetical protein
MNRRRVKPLSHGGKLNALPQLIRVLKFFSICDGGHRRRNAKVVLFYYCSFARKQAFPKTAGRTDSSARRLPFGVAAKPASAARFFDLQA